MEFAISLKYGNYPIYPSEINHDHYHNLFLKCPECHQSVFLRKSSIKTIKNKTINIPAHFSHHKYTDEAEDQPCLLRAKRYTQENLKTIISESKGQFLKIIKENFYKIYFGNHKLYFFNRPKYKSFYSILEKKNLSLGSYIIDILLASKNQIIPSLSLSKITKDKQSEDITWFSITNAFREKYKNSSDLIIQEINQQAKNIKALNVDPNKSTFNIDLKYLEFFKKIKKIIESSLHQNICQEIFLFLLSEQNKNILVDALFLETYLLDYNLDSPDEISIQNLENYHQQTFINIIETIILIPWFDKFERIKNKQNISFSEVFDSHQTEEIKNNSNEQVLSQDDNYKLETENKKLLSNKTPSWVQEEIEKYIKNKGKNNDLLRPNSLFLASCNKEKLEEIPIEILELEDLRILYLQDNAIKSIPENIDRLKNLEYLDISSNQIEFIPESIGRLKNLKWLDLSSNKIEFIPENIGQLENLGLLNLELNQIEFIPDSIGKLKKLSTLRLHNNKIKKIPNSLGNLIELAILNLANNYIENLPKTICDLINLRYLLLQSNEFKIFPHLITKLPELVGLYLSENQLKSIPESIASLKKIEIIHFQNNQLSGLPESICDLENLQEINISSNPLQSLPIQFRKVLNLIELHQMPEWVQKRIKKVKKNKSTSLKLNRAYDSSLERLTKFPKIINDLTHLKKLNLFNNSIRHLPESISKLKNLTELNCERNDLEEFPIALTHLNKLSILCLNYNDLKSLPDEIVNLSNLNILDINGNSNLKRIPSNLDKLEKLLSFRVYGISDEDIFFPDTIGKLQVRPPKVDGFTAYFKYNTSEEEDKIILYYYNNKDPRKREKVSKKINNDSTIIKSNNEVKTPSNYQIIQEKYYLEPIKLTTGQTNTSEAAKDYNQNNQTSINKRDNDTRIDKNKTENAQFNISQTSNNNVRIQENNLPNINLDSLYYLYIRYVNKLIKTNKTAEIKTFEEWKSDFDL